MKIGIITDSAADLPKELLEKYDISVIPHVVYFDDKHWRLGVDISIEDFYKLIETRDLIPPTTNPDPGDFDAELIKRFQNEKYDHIISISVSKELSGSTFNSHRMAAKKHQGKVTVIDTLSASGVQGLIALNVAILIEKGHNIQNIIKTIDNLKEQYYLNVGFHTLDNVYKSGRLKSKFTLYMTKLIGIKPFAVMKRPGILQNSIPGFFTNNSIVKRIAKSALKGIDKSLKYDVVISHFENKNGVKKILQILNKRISIAYQYITPVSPIIGTTTGKGTIILSLLPHIEENDNLET